jgi:mono/diheme cytochrome c family protein
MHRERENPRRRWTWLGACAAVALTAGCQKMNTGGRLRPYQPDAFFANGSVAQLPVAGTVPHDEPLGDEAFLQGTKAGIPVQQIPVPVTEALLRRGRQRFEIFCSPCHSIVGDGQGMIVHRGLSAPPSYHIDRLRNAPAGHFFDVITHGYGAMFSYADRVPVADRWAIVGYIRALQRSQHARYSDLPPALQQAVQKEGPVAPEAPGGSEE